MLTTCCFMLLVGFRVRLFSLNENENISDGILESIHVSKFATCSSFLQIEARNFTHLLAGLHFVLMCFQVIGDPRFSFFKQL